MSKRILVVEDQEDNRRILRDLLTSVGYELVEAVSGEDGVLMAETQAPDLILMDIQLPGLDGYEATRRIKANVELRQIPIIAVTSYALSGDDAKAFEAGCDAYVSKPFSPRALLAKKGVRIFERRTKSVQRVERRMSAPCPASSRASWRCSRCSRSAIRPTRSFSSSSRTSPAARDSFR